MSRPEGEVGPATPTVIYTTHRQTLLPEGERTNLVDLLDRVLARGVVVNGELTLSVAEVDLVHLSLRALLSAIRPDLFTGPAGDGAAA